LDQLRFAPWMTHPHRDLKCLFHKICTFPAFFSTQDSRSLVEVDWWRRRGVPYVMRTRVATRCHGAGVLCAYADTPCASCHPCQSRPSVSDYLAVGVVCSVRSRAYRTTDIIPSATQSRKAKGWIKHPAQNEVEACLLLYATQMTFQTSWLFKTWLATGFFEIGS
jgi:hypothetical protein